MRHVILIILITLTQNISAQDFDISQIPLKDSLPFYEVVVELKGKNIEDIYSAAKISMVKNLGEGNQFTQTENSDNKNIVGRAITNIVRYDTLKSMGYTTILTIEYTIRYMLSISAKYEKYRVQLYDHIIETKVTSFGPSLQETTTEGHQSTFKEFIDCHPVTEGKKRGYMKKLEEMQKESCIKAVKSIHNATIGCIEQIKSSMQASIKELSEDW